MKRSTEWVLTTHAGSLPQPADLQQMLIAKNNGQPYDVRPSEGECKALSKEAVRKQIDCGLDIINDGELGKPNFSRYPRERLSGFVERRRWT